MDPNSSVVQFRKLQIEDYSSGESTAPSVISDFSSLSHKDEAQDQKNRQVNEHLGGHSAVDDGDELYAKDPCDTLNSYGYNENQLNTEVATLTEPDRIIVNNFADSFIPIQKLQSKPEVLSASKLQRQKQRYNNALMTNCNSLGCEVNALDGIKQHLFIAEVELNSKYQSKEESCINGNGNNCNDNILLNFSRHINDEIEGNEYNLMRLSILCDRTPQPLYLTGKNKFKNLKNSEYNLIRYPDTLKIEYNKDYNTDLNQNVDDLAKINALRPTFYNSARINEGRKLKVDIIRVNKDDTIQIFINDTSLEEDYRQLKNLMKVYYDVNLTGVRQKREMIPKKKVKKEMIAVALVYPHTPFAKFIRARVLGFIKPNTTTRPDEIKSGSGQKSKKNLEQLYVSVCDVDAWDLSSIIVPLGCLFFIDQAFMKLPFLMNKYQLKGLAFFKGTGIIHHHFKQIVNITSDQFFAFFSDSSGSAGTAVASLSASDSQEKENVVEPGGVELYLGRGKTEQPVNYLFVQAIMEYLTPAVEPTISKQAQAHIAHCDSQGNFWFLLDSEILARLISFGQEIDSTIQQLQRETIQSISDNFFKNEVYVARASVDQQLHRVHVTEILYEENRVRAEFIDWGSEETVNVSDGIYKAKNIDKLYAALPSQAIQVHIEGLDEVLNCEHIMNCLNNIPVLLKETKEKDECACTTKHVTVSAFIETISKGRTEKVPFKDFIRANYCDS